MTYLVGRGAPAAIGFAALISYSHLVPPSVYGYFAVVLGLSNICSGTFTVWIRIATTRFAATLNSRSDAMIGLGLFIFAIVLSFVALGTTLAALFVGARTALEFFVLVLALSASDFALDLVRARHDARLYGVLYFARQLSSVAIAFALIFSAIEINPLVWGMAGGAATTVLLSGRYWLPRASFAFKRAEIPTFLRYGLPLMTTYTISSLANSGDRLLVAVFLGEAAAGLYALAADFVTQVLNVLMDGVTLGFLPQAAWALEHEGLDAARNVLRNNAIVLLLIAVPSALGLCVVGPRLAGLLFGPDFSGAASILVPLVSIAILCRGLRVYFLDNVFQIAHRTGRAALLSLLNVCVLATTAVLGLPPFGLWWAGLASLVAALFTLAVGVVLARPLVGENIPWREAGQIAAGAAAVNMVAALAILLIPGAAGIGVAVTAAGALYFLLVRRQNLGGAAASLFARSRE